MTRMTPRTPTVIGGVDTPSDTHEAAALNGQGRLLGVRRFANTPQGCQQLLDWLRSLGSV